jgi:hypothetical protein
MIVLEFLLREFHSPLSHHARFTVAEKGSVATIISEELWSEEKPGVR